ncbi:MAG: 4Fe-4S dicluster domain-containing protein [PVC group bacterium]|nr:4Fe-4S dicluster domain-containing protein [PVC group bacterium]
MSLFTIDKEKCVGDGACAAACPRNIIQIKENLPTPVAEAETLCINCGHCVSVCPHGALSLKTMSPEQCTSLPENWQLSPDQIELFFKGRKSIRCYKDEAVECEKLLKLIDIARYAPSGINLQPVKWLIIENKDDVQHLAGIVIDWMRNLITAGNPIAEALHFQGIVSAWEADIDLVCRNAPHIIIAYGLQADMTAPQSCMIALTHLELAASAFKLGCCWAGYFQMAASMWPPMQEALKINRRQASYGAMMIGYPKFQYKRTPLRNEAQVTWR